uniref:Uncharacterized protein n=1 Tax=Anguilla anguilla TaxID=7936 RepID=A0A0E9WJE5_ANGAN
MRFEASGWICADKMFLYTSEIILLLPSAVTSSMKTNEPDPEVAIHDQAITLPPPSFTKWGGGLLWVMSSSSISLHFTLSINLVPVTAGLICP